MKVALYESWTKLLTPVFPVGAEFNTQEISGNYRLSVFWKLESDPERPNKPSKTIQVIISKEVIDDYVNKSENHRRADDEKLK